MGCIIENFWRNAHIKLNEKASRKIETKKGFKKYVNEAIMLRAKELEKYYNAKLIKVSIDEIFMYHNEDFDDDIVFPRTNSFFKFRKDD